MMNQRLKIEVRGIVQGVGFRPYVYRLAHRFGLVGNILNSETGVSIEIQGAVGAVLSFMEALPAEAPPLARVLEVESSEMNLLDESSFVILESTRSGSAATLISPDIATCPDCIREFFDPADRRYLYPFINCTNCGPRFTIVRSIPYDRTNTSMASFTMCQRCQSEYDDPFDRRFHAQPNACWDCGPQLQLVDRSGAPMEGDPMDVAIQLLQRGHILAVKGIGGFHLAADAFNPLTVQELRRRKGRQEKSFAIMVAGLATAQELCSVDEGGAALLESPQRPIVLLPKISSRLDYAAPGVSHLGIFLPYTPIHHLLVGSHGLRALVMTSGNLSEEPIAIDNDEALDRLTGLADFFLLHNRKILLRCDDSVVRRIAGKTQFACRSRGFVPSPILLGEPVPPILAVGGELKNAICLSRDRLAFVGQHIGDMEELSAYNFFRESIRHFEDTLEVTPHIVAHDLHPAYLSTQWAKGQHNVRLVGVQHHHAHIASCMAENHLSGPVIGIALDGMGYGTDGNAWGGEVLIATYKSFRRAAHFAYTPMPGGAQAIREPWRMAVSYLWQPFGSEWRTRCPPALLSNVPESSLRFVEQLLRNGSLSQLTSSCGRLFDAVAALACNRTEATYEAQAAITLETCCDPSTGVGAYPFSLSMSECLQIDAGPLFVALTDDISHNISPGILSRRFHNGLVKILAEVVNSVAQESGLHDICLSGGSFQNRVLSEDLETSLSMKGFNVFTQTQVPCGDGGLSLGQLMVAAHCVGGPVV